MTALLIGSGGQDGPYLAQILQNKGFDTVTASRSDPARPLDVRDTSAVEQLIASVRPSRIFNLAATSATGHHLLMDHHQTIGTGTLNLLEAARKHVPDAKIFLPGSGLQFVNSGLPIRETDAFEAGSAYALARIHSAFAARYYRSLGLKVYFGYLFNHDSPRRSDKHLNTRIIAEVRAIREGRQQRIRIGDPAATKEYGYAPEIMAGAVALTEQDAVYEAVIGTGQGHTVEDWIRTCCALAGVDYHPGLLERDESFRGAYSALVSAPATMASLGWTHQTRLEDLARKMFFNDDNA